MPRTYFQDFNREDGTSITVEYSFSPGSPTTYSPMIGACGGDACDVEIIKAFTDTEKDVVLTDLESERFTDWLIEHHPDDDDDFNDVDLL